MPTVVVVGKGLLDGVVELRNRRTGEVTVLPVGDLVSAIAG